MNSSSTKILGHADRITKTIEVKKPAPREKWTNRTTTLVEKYCDFHKKNCEFSQKAVKCKERRREEYKNRKTKNEPSDKNITCRVCKEELSSSNFYDDPSTVTGKTTICKTCKKEYDKERHNEWPVLFKRSYRTALRAHGNKDEINPISLKECEELLKKQNGKCNHCKVKLSSKQGTVIDVNYTRASLDRINVNIVGYGSGNAQWLCVSCNKGKCTMSDNDYKMKYSKFTDRIEYLENLLRKHKISFDEQESETEDSDE